MNLDLSPDQILMRDEARRLLAECADPSALRRAIESGGFDSALWQTVGAELGWCAVAIPEEIGGLGLGSLEAALLAEECGRRLAPVPFWSSACAAAPVIAALVSEPARSKLLGRIAGGEAAALALDLATLAIQVAARRTENGWRLNGRIANVLDAASAGYIVVPARTDDGALGLFLVDRPAIAPVIPDFDLTWPSAPVVLDHVALPPQAALTTGLGDEELHRALRVARLGLAATQVGAAQGALDTTLAYISERVQFGRTIASFQAVKHRCAVLVVEIAEARALLYGAAGSLDAGAADVDMELAALGALASEVVFRAAEEAIQLHGGVGNTFEYEPHLYLRRAQATAHLFGSAGEKLATLADAIFGAAA